MFLARVLSGQFCCSSQLKSLSVYFKDIEKQHVEEKRKDSNTRVCVNCRPVCVCVHDCVVSSLGSRIFSYRRAEEE